MNPKERIFTTSLDNDEVLAGIREMVEEAYRRELVFDSEYEGVTQANIGVRRYNEYLRLDYRYNIGYLKLTNDFGNFVRHVERLVIQGILNLVGIQGDVEYAYLNFPVFHILDRPVPNSKPHRDLANYTKEDIVANMDAPKLLTAVLCVKPAEEGGALMINGEPYIEEEGSLVIFDSAFAHDIEPFKGERISFVFQFLVEKNSDNSHILYHYI